MFDLLKIKSLKAILLITRRVSRRYVYRRFAKKLYYWSDFHLQYTVGRIFILPGFVYRAWSAILNYVISVNTIDIKSLHVHSKPLGNFADKLMHHIPDEFRFSTPKPVRKEVVP